MCIRDSDNISQLILFFLYLLIFLVFMKDFVCVSRICFEIFAIPFIITVFICSWILNLDFRSSVLFLTWENFIKKYYTLYCTHVYIQISQFLECQYSSNCSLSLSYLLFWLVTSYLANNIQEYLQFIYVSRTCCNCQDFLVDTSCSRINGI